MGVGEDVKPDLMFTFLFSDEFDPVLLKKITEQTKTITFNWFADDHWRFETFSRFWAPCFSFVSTTDVNAVPKYRAAGYRNVLLTQWAANPRIYVKRDVPQNVPVSFVGQVYGDRPEMIRALSKSGIDVQTWGAYWNLRRWHTYTRRLRLISADRYERIINSTRITQEEMIQIFNVSRINLNLSRSSQQGENQIKGRNFEIPACGGFQLSGYARGFEEYFALDTEIVCYRTQDELLEKGRYYLDHEEERAAIAEAGYRRVMRDHTYAHRFHRLFRDMHLE